MDYTHAAYFQGAQQFPPHFMGIHGPPLTPSHSNSAGSDDFNTTSPPVGCPLPPPAMIFFFFFCERRRKTHQEKPEETIHTCITLISPACPLHSPHFYSVLARAGWVCSSSVPSNASTKPGLGSDDKKLTNVSVTHIGDLRPPIRQRRRRHPPRRRRRHPSRAVRGLRRLRGRRRTLRPPPPAPAIKRVRSGPPDAAEPAATAAPRPQLAAGWARDRAQCRCRLVDQAGDRGCPEPAAGVQLGGGRPHAGAVETQGAE